jgi:hypothetical protein
MPRQLKRRNKSSAGKIETINFEQGTKYFKFGGVNVEITYAGGNKILLRSIGKIGRNIKIIPCVSNTIFIEFTEYGE